MFSIYLCAYFKGCGRYAGGQGYNSIGHFCGGWAGNCGDGGIGGSTWYLVCDRCREKYLREKQAAAREKVVLFCSGYTVNYKDKPYKNLFLATWKFTTLETQTGALKQPEGWAREGGGREVQKRGDVYIPVADSC